ncbi:MAG: hypothetical protein KJN98_04185, partial [Pontiella sp.]|nr:hypothetical protein [Pontiella sp.]
MLNHLSRRIFAASLCCGAVCTTAQRGKQCAVCGSRISGRYWVYNQMDCCSQACVDALRPRCSACGKAVSPSYVKADGKAYCNSICFESTLPACKICKAPIRSGYHIGRHRYCEACVKNKPVCFSCGLPAAYSTRIEDGREICTGCMRWAVKTEDTAQQHYDRALRYLQAWTSLTIASVPKLKLIDRKEMKKLSKKIRTSDSPVSIRGLYSRQT